MGIHGKRVAWMEGLAIAMTTANSRDKAATRKGSISNPARKRWVTILVGDMTTRLPTVSYLVRSGRTIW